MAEYIPQPQLPTGLAAEVIRLKQKQEENRFRLGPEIINTLKGLAMAGFAGKAVGYEKEQETAKTAETFRQQKELEKIKSTSREDLAREKGLIDLVKTGKFSQKAPIPEGLELTGNNFFDYFSPVEKPSPLLEIIKTGKFAPIKEIPKGTELTPENFFEHFKVIEKSPGKSGAGIDRGSEDWNRLIDKVGTSNGKWIADDIFRGMGQAEARRSFVEDLIKKYPDYDTSKALMNRRQAIATGQMKGTYGTRMATAAQAVDRNMQDLAVSIPLLPNTGIEMINDAVRKGLRQVQDPQANEVFAMMRTTAFEEAVVESGGYAPSEIAQREMLRVLTDGLSAEGFSGVQKALEKSNMNRILSYDDPWDLSKMQKEGKVVGEPEKPTPTTKKKADVIPATPKKKPSKEAVDYIKSLGY